MIDERSPRLLDADRLYERHVKPLGREHWGHYATVTLAEETIIAPSLLETIQEADEHFGQDPTVTFKIGAKVVGKIR